MPSGRPIRSVSLPISTTWEGSTTAPGISAPSFHTPLRPSTRVVSTPNSEHARISASSSRRTYATTSIGSGSFTIG